MVAIEIRHLAQVRWMRAGFRGERSIADTAWRIVSGTAVAGM
jgi:hypothetical protein